jgi:hypothetical protein
MTDQPDLSIIIVNWRSAAFVRNCLSRLIERTRGRWYARAYHLTMLLAGVCRLVLLSGLVLTPISDRRRGCARVCFRKWLRITGWSLGLESWSAELAQQHTRKKPA